MVNFGVVQIILRVSILKTYKYSLTNFESRWSNQFRTALKCYSYPILCEYDEDGTESDNNFLLSVISRSRGERIGVKAEDDRHTPAVGCENCQYGGLYGPGSGTPRGEERYTQLPDRR